VQGEETGFPAQADDLENFTQPEVFEVTDKAHGSSMGRDDTEQERILMHTPRQVKGIAT
jgi:hypothetical protein